MEWLIFWRKKLFFFYFYFSLISFVKLSNSTFGISELILIKNKLKQLFYQQKRKKQKQFFLKDKIKEIKFQTNFSVFFFFCFFFSIDNLSNLKIYAPLKNIWIENVFNEAS